MGVREKKKLLEAFVTHNAELEKFERRLSRLNVFEAVGVSRQELRHSDFLSFILDPSRNHGLGDYVVKRILKELARKCAGSGISPVDVDVIDLEGLEVRREWRQFDILMIDEHHELLVLIENKVGASAGNKQLTETKPFQARPNRTSA